MQIEKTNNKTKLILFQKELNTINIRNPEDIIYFLEYLKFEKREHLLAITLNKKLEIIDIHTINIGHFNINIVHPKNIMHPIINDDANAFMIIHNHPSGDPRPSKSDRFLTQYLQKITRLLDIELIDHLIISELSYFSFKQMALL